MRISLLFIDNCFAPFAPGHQNHIRKKAPHASCVSRLWLEVPPRFELGNKGFADLCLTTWPWHHTLILWKRRSKYYILSVLSINGADDEARTRYLHLGKVALYQMSYIRVSRPLSADVVVPPIGIEPMTRGFSVPCSTDWATEANMATRNGLEPSTSSVTG